jgi:poly [ADP-ribose] polymerase 2/3/4
LRIAPPEAPATGYMFGKGIYLADMSSKSANYCFSYNSGGTGLLLLCEAELGDPMYELTDAQSSAGEEAKKQGKVATWGKGTTTPLKWKDAACIHESLKGVSMVSGFLHRDTANQLNAVIFQPDVSVAPGASNVPGASLYYNEYIVYDVQQVRLRYLLRVQMR